jgi:hypothetical protein
MGFQLPIFVFSHPNADNGWVTMVSQQYLPDQGLCKTGSSGNTTTCHSYCPSDLIYIA